MRGFPIGSGTIQIASVAGERRHVSVSGVAKVRLLWLFRNFYILECRVLSKEQQQLIARLWQAGTSAGSVDALALIGTIEGFSPQLGQPTVATTKSSRPDGHFGLSWGAIWSAVGILLLGCAMGLGAKFGWMTQIRVALVAAVHPVSSTVAVPAVTAAKDSAKSEAPVADIPTAATTETPGFLPEDVRASEVRPPDAMAEEALSLTGKPRVAGAAKVSDMAGIKAVEKPEIIIRVSVDGQGRAQTFEVVRGDEKKVSAALAAAKRWAFQPCSGGGDCEHLLKFTDYGGASVVRMVE